MTTYRKVMTAEDVAPITRSSANQMSRRIRATQCSTMNMSRIILVNLGLFLDNIANNVVVMSSRHP